MLLETAQQFADNRNLDLVLISPNASPPVARIMDYGKYRYEQQKREKEAKKKQKVIQVKEVRLSPSIETHDLAVKASHAAKFLDEGDKVKVSLRFRGRERGRTEKGFEVMERFAEIVKENGNLEKRAAFEGRNLIMILAPLTEKERRTKVKAAEQKEQQAQDEASGQVQEQTAGVTPVQSAGQVTDKAPVQATQPASEQKPEQKPVAGETAVNAEGDTI
jgi:translation initiation factor IF-3